MIGSNKEEAMGQTLFLGIVLLVFVGFGFGLAWADYSGRGLHPPASGPKA